MPLSSRAQLELWHLGGVVITVDRLCWRCAEPGHCGHGCVTVYGAMSGPGRHTPGVAPYLLGTRRYPSKTAARDEFRRILNSNPDNVPLRGEDAELVALQLYDGRHPEAAEKIGPGVVDIVIRRSEFLTRGFWLVRRDGSIVDFSYLTALDGQPSVEAEARAALRWEINDQILAFRDVHAADLVGGSMACGLCQQPMTPDNVHVDHHEPTFAELASRFAEVLGGWDRLVVEWVGATGRILQNRDHGDVWQIFHRQTARLRLTHRRCNLTRARTFPRQLVKREAAARPSADGTKQQ